MEIGVINRGNHRICIWLQWKEINKHIYIWIIRRNVTHIKSSIFDFNLNIPNKNSSHQKYCVVNNHYPWQGDYQRQSTVMTNIFSLSESQNNVSIRVNLSRISLKVIVHDRGSDRNSPRQQSKIFLHQKVSLLLCSYIISMIQI